MWFRLLATDAATATVADVSLFCHRTELTAAMLAFLHVSRVCFRCVTNDD